jgi:colicin import membrane protein
MPGQHTGAVFFSIALHVAIVAALTLTFRWPINVRVASAPAPIQGMIVDSSVLKAEQQRKDQEAQQKQREEREKREAEQQKQREKEAADKRERDRLAEQQRLKEQADREKAEAAKVAQEKAAKEKEARDKQAKEDAARKQKEALAAKQKAQLDAETQREAAQEAARMEAERSGAFDEYVRQIQNQIARNWNQPLSAKPGLECVINVVQLPTGDVFDAKVDDRRCNGDDAVKRSIEAAVRKASPLPKPPTQAVYERNLIVTFRPDVEPGQ